MPTAPTEWMIKAAKELQDDRTSNGARLILHEELVQEGYEHTASYHFTEVPEWWSGCLATSRHPPCLVLETILHPDSIEIFSHTGGGAPQTSYEATMQTIERMSEADATHRKRVGPVMPPYRLQQTVTRYDSIRAQLYRMPRSFYLLGHLYHPSCLGYITASNIYRAEDQRHYWKTFWGEFTPRLLIQGESNAYPWAAYPDVKDLTPIPDYSAHGRSPLRRL